MLAVRSRRHLTRIEDYNPSRRSNAPMPPCSEAASAFARICCLYAAVNFRRFALATTSGSGRTIDAALAPALPSAALRSASLRSSSLRAADGKAEEDSDGTGFCILIFPSALLTNYEGKGVSVTLARRET